MIIQILAARIGFGDAVNQPGLVHVPLHEVYRTAELAAPAKQAVRLCEILLPSGVNCLRVAVGAARPRPGDKAQHPGARRAGAGLKTGFLIHNRHRHRHRAAPALGRLLRLTLPAEPLIKDSAQITRLHGRAPDATLQHQRATEQAEAEGAGGGHGGGLEVGFGG